MAYRRNVVSDALAGSKGKESWVLSVGTTGSAPGRYDNLGLEYAVLLTSCEIFKGFA